MDTVEGESFVLSSAPAAPARVLSALRCPALLYVTTAAPSFPSPVSQVPRCKVGPGTTSPSPSPSQPQPKRNSCTPGKPPAFLFSTSTSVPFEAIHTSTMRLPSAIDLTSLKMPSLHCSFPPSVHSDYTIVKQQCDAWIEEVAEPPSASASSFLHDCLLPLLVCRCIPKSISQRRLVHAIKAIAWLMIADDDDDNPNMLGSDCATTSHRAGIAMAILRGVDECDKNSVDCSFLEASVHLAFANKMGRMLKALAELWSEIRQEMPPSLRARFIATMADYFEGLKVQASFREKAIIPSVDSYMEIRRQASFTIPCFILIEYALGIELDDTTFYNPLIQELHNVALDYISLCNDVVSCRIEISTGDYFNLPSILYNSQASEQSLPTFQSTIEYVFQMTQDLDNRAISLVSTIHKESEHFDYAMLPFIHAYVEGLHQCMSGATTWFLETARYQHANRRHELHQLP